MGQYGKTLNNVFVPAKSSLALAKQRSSEIYREDLCFQAQQAAEKAIKALYISKKLVFPYIHDIAQLLSSLEKSGIIIPKEIQSASRLTRYAAQTRYPGVDGPVSGDVVRREVLVKYKREILALLRIPQTSVVLRELRVRSPRG